MRVGWGGEVMMASDQSARPAWAGRVNLEQLQQLGLQWWWCGNGRRVVAAGGVEAQPGQRLEHQPAGRLGGSADIQPGKLDGGGDGLADRPLDQAEHQQRQAYDRDERGDAAVVFEEHGRDAKGALERAVAAFDDFLAFVAAQDLG